MDEWKKIDLSSTKENIEISLRQFIELEKRLKEELIEKLGRDLESDKIMISEKIKILTKVKMQIKYYNLFLKNKGVEVFSYLSDNSNWRKTEQKIREAFHIPDSIPVIYK